MKKSLVALAVFGAFSGLAYAEDTSVTLYGIIDAGVMSQSKSGNYTNGANGNGSTLGFVDAQILPSIYGIKGSEDLGGGLKAGFNLEGGFDTHNGEHNSPGVVQSQIFGREAKVTLGGDWGTVGAGLQVDPALIAAIGTEPRGMTDSLSSLEYWIIGTVGNGPAPNGGLTGGIFDQNALSYTYSGNGLYLGLIYSFGGVSGSTGAYSGESIGASYKNSGFIVSAGYAENKANVAATLTTPGYTGTSSKIDFIGAGYDFAPFAVRVQYQEFKSGYSVTGANANDVKDFGIGFDWSMGANKLNLAYYRAKDDGANLGGKTTELALLDTYGLSKRTSVYGQVASVKTDDTAGNGVFLGGLGAYTAAVGALGTSSLYIGLGVQHTF
jgi:predicted porin